MMKKMQAPLYIKILLGMAIGIVVGFIALGVKTEWFINDWVRPWGGIFIKLLQLIAIPLVFFSLIKGVAGLKDIGRFSRMGGRTLCLYMSTTFVAVLLGLALALTIQPGKLFNADKAKELNEKYITKVGERQAAVESVALQGPLQFLDDIVPANITEALGNNRNMLQVIFFAILFGLAILLIEPVKTAPVVALVDSVYDILLKIVDFFISFAPYGVFALMAGLIIDFSGDTSVFSALAVYACTVVVGLLTIQFLLYPLLVKLFTKHKMIHFIKTMYPVQLFAFTTSSSAATIPLTMEVVERDLKVPNEITSFIIPIGATINMDGTSLYQAIAVVFIAQVIGIELSIVQLLTVLAMTVLSSIGTPSIPGGSFVILSLVLSSVGIPVEGLALILGIDRPLDMLRTSCNVTGDATVCTIVHAHTR